MCFDVTVMMNGYVKFAALAAALSLMSQAVPAGELSDDIRISSKYMGYDLQYRVYTPDGIEEGVKYPVLFVTDGWLYVAAMHMPDVLDELMGEGRIRKAFVIFVDARNPDDLEENRRDSEYMCKVEYINFYTAELMPHLYENYPISVEREDTNILGLSFGGLNSACFGLLASNRFSGIGMHSPASGKHLKKIGPMFEKIETEPLRIFISVGTVNDNLRAVRRFRDLLESRGYEVTYIENKGKAHNFENWSGLLDDALLTLLPAGSP